MFNECLAQCLEDGIVPLGFNVRPEEWDDHGYPSFEIIKSGRCGTKELRVPLPIDDWLTKAQLWVQALVLMSTLLKDSS